LEIGEESSELDSPEEDPDAPEPGTETEPTPYQGVTGPHEWELFELQLHTFFKNAASEAILGSESLRTLSTTYDMARFAAWWNQNVKDNEEIDVGERKCLFRKTAGILQDHYQKHKRH
jgi:hypothetical protein